MFPKEAEQEEWRRMEAPGHYPWITDCQWGLGHVFLASFWNSPSLAAVLIECTHRDDFLTIAKSPEGMITLLLEF